MSENFFKNILLEVPVAIAMFDREMNYLAASGKWLEEYGLEEEKINGKNHYKFFPFIQEKWRKIHEASLNGSHLKNNAEKIIQDDGSIQWLSWEAKPWKDDNGEIGGITVYTHDITQQKKSEELLYEVSEVAKVGGWEVDPGSNLLAWTGITREIHEVSPDFLPTLEKSIAFYKEGQDRVTIEKLINEAIKSGNPYDIELKIVTAKGNERWVRTKGKAEFLEGKCTRLFGTIQDIHERKEAELQLKESEEKFRFLTENMKNIVCLHEPDGTYTYLSPSFKEIMGYDQSEMIGKNPYEFFHPDDQSKIKEGSHDEALTGNDNEGIEYRFLTKSGKYLWVNTLTRSIVENGKVIGLQTDTYVIQERKELEELLRQSEETFKGAFEYSAIGMALVSQRGEFLSVNERLTNITGYSKEEHLKLTFQDITHKEDLEQDLIYLQELVRGDRKSYNMEKRYFHKDGYVIWVELAVSMVKDNVGKPLYFIVQIKDITDEKIAKEQLQNTLSKLQSVLDASNQVAIVGTDENGVINTFNKGAENMLKYSSEEVVGIHTPETFHLKEELDKLSMELSTDYEKVEGFDVFLTLTQQGAPDIREWTFKDKFGYTFPVQVSLTAIKNKKGEVIGYLGVAMDISMLKQKEQELQELVKMTGDQNKRLLNFAHIVSHNLKSYARNLTMMIDFLEHEQEEKRKKEYFSMIKKASEGLNETVKHLNEVVTINTDKTEDRKWVNVREEIDKVQNNTRALIMENDANVINEVAEDFQLNVVPAYMDSILLNFMTNSIKYKSPERAPVIKFTSSQEKGVKSISISDNGLGIDLEKHGDKLFGMYKTFHPNKDARGIGLFITKNQIEAMGGQVEVESQPGEGTTFKINFYKKN